MKFRFNTKRSKKITNIESLIPDIVSEFNIKDSFIIENIRSEWNNFVGEILSSHSIPDRIFKNILFITTDHSVYANELTMMKESILQQIREKVPAASVNTIKMEIKRLQWNNH